ncbi:MAG: hypothetical protein QOJ39_1816, partial [Candidatus Eremiobacteraeota bacterium]|nr:hypothetical protein [Candidatus Eremiobacteraeota bacterium]
MTRTVSSRDVAIVTLLAVAAVFVLLPIASTGFLGDDQFNSSVNGLLETSKRSFAEFAWTTTLSFFHETARFVPGASFIAYGIFHFVPNLLAYKCLQVAALAADLVLFAVLLRMLGAGTAFIALAGVIALASVQFHGHYDGYLGFAMTEE